MNGSVGKVGSTKVVAHVDGQEYNLEIADGGSSSDLVSLLLDAEIPVPYSCREGDCSSCIGKMVKGSVSEEPSDVLAQSDREIGYIVTCLARPASSYVEVSFDD